MITFNNFDIVCRECGENIAHIGVSSILDKDAEIFAYCPNCNKTEFSTTIIRDANEQLEN